jgi:uncharacterized protein
VDKIRLGRTGAMVSALGFGGIPIQRLDTAQAVQVVTRCLDLGVTFLDTAHGYTTSEERVGQAIRGRREGLFLATKSHALEGPAFRQEMAQSFDRLGVQHIDLLQFHNISSAEELDKVLAPGGPLEVAREAQAAGRVGHLGVTSHSLRMALALVPSGHFETLMFPFCFATPEPAEELIPLCRQHDVGFIAMKPMGGGLIENPRLALGYLRQFPDILALVGMQAVSEADELAAALAGPAVLSPAEAAEMQRITSELGPRYCRACDYCQPCTQGIQISWMMRVRSHARRFPLERVYGAWGEGIVSCAETCVDCGECEPRCPYKLPIRATMRDNVAWYHEEVTRYRRR